MRLAAIEKSRSDQKSSCFGFSLKFGVLQSAALLSRISQRTDTSFNATKGRRFSPPRVTTHDAKTF